MEILLKDFDDKYLLSSDGFIFSLKGKKKRLSGKVGKAGYFVILINHKGSRKYLLLHRLIAENFVPNPENKRTVNHKDGNKLNNHYLNIEWNTDKENLIHARDNNLLNTKIDMEIAEKIRVDSGSIRELSLKYGISKSQVGYIKQNKRWRKE